MTRPSSNPKPPAARKASHWARRSLCALALGAAFSLSCATRGFSPDTSNRVESKQTAGGSVSKSGNVTTNQGITSMDVVIIIGAYMTLDLIKDIVIAGWMMKRRRANEDF